MTKELKECPKCKSTKIRTIATDIIEARSIILHLQCKNCENSFEARKKAKITQEFINTLKGKEILYKDMFFDEKKFSHGIIARVNAYRGLFREYDYELELDNLRRINLDLCHILILN